MPVILTSMEHADVFRLLQIQAHAGQDREYQSALYVLAALASSSGKDILKYIGRREINFTKLMDDSAPWSSSEKALVKLAACLFSGYAWPVSVHEVFYNLDRANTKIALDALWIRYGA